MKKRISSLFGKLNSGDRDLLDVLLGQNRERENAETDGIDAEWQKRAEQLEQLEMRFFRRAYPILSVILCLFFAAVLIITVSYLPSTGAGDTPTNNEVIDRYLEKGLEETGALNAVSGMILYYRAFDTLGEAHVLFAGVCAVTILLSEHPTKRKKKQERLEDSLFSLERDPILSAVSRVLIPILFLYGLYVIFNGHLSPGGGFSGGAIIGSALILYSSVFGFEKTGRFFNEKVYSAIKVSALLLYSVIMLYFFYTGANGLDLFIYLGKPGNIISAGYILPINIAVGFEVACTIYGLYSLFKRGRI